MFYTMSLCIHNSTLAIKVLIDLHVYYEVYTIMVLEILGSKNINEIFIFII